MAKVHEDATITQHRVRFRSCGLTDPGCVRNHNEDAFLELPDRELWVVADGMGGHSAGEVASQAIVSRLSQLQRHGTLADFIDAVEDGLFAVNADLREQARATGVPLIGATVVVLIGAGDFVLCGWAGDSRAYRFHAGAIERISQDHSSVQELINAGALTPEEAHEHPEANAITRAVGGEEHLYLDWVVAACEPGTQFLLCTDGVTKELADSQLEAHFRKGAPPWDTAAAIIEAGIAAGGRDNLTAIVVRAER